MQPMHLTVVAEVIALLDSLHEQLFKIRRCDQVGVDEERGCAVVFVEYCEDLLEGGLRVRSVVDREDRGIGGILVDDIVFP